MSLRILVIGPESSGTSTVAGEVAKLVHKAADRQGKPLALCTVPSLVYGKMGVRVKPARSARELVESLGEAKGTVIVDQFSEIYSGLTGSYTEATRRARAERDLPEHWGALGPHDFRTIKERLDSVYRTVSGLDLDLIEIYRLGHGENGEERVRGASGTGRGAALILLLEGGLSPYRGDRRRIRVFTDHSLRASKEPRELPRIETPRDLQELRMLLSGMLSASVKDLLEMAREEAGLWANAPTITDEWPEVEGLAQKVEVDLYASEFKAVCEINEIPGRERTKLLYEIFRVGDLESLALVPPLTLRLNRERFIQAANLWAKRKQERDWILSQVKQRLAMYKLSGQGQEAQSGRALHLSQHFETDLDGLNGLELERLKEGFVAFSVALPPLPVNGMSQEGAAA